MIKKNTLLVLFALTFCLSSFSQNFWSKQESKNDFVKQKEVLHKKNFPNKYQIMTLELDNFKNYLSKNHSKNSNLIIELPDANGVLKKFSVKETPYLAPELAAKFPMIKSYSAQGIDDPTANAKISLGTDGLHTIIFSGNQSTIYIDPYTKNKKEYIIYKREDLNKKENDFECEVKENSKKVIESSLNYRNANDGKLRTYRLAIACSGEYAQFHLTRQGVSAGETDAVKKAAVLSAMNTSMTRINGVFERDLAVRMVIVANNENVIFLNGATDGITDTDGSAGTMINEVQTICDNQIGNANYDIGHLFSTKGSGLASLNSVCATGSKARGVTGRDEPVGDPYDIDYVSHEMGHQFGATHTQNNSCNRTNATAVEPGSASSIMGYAGICAPNVQGNSDDHFHAVSIAQMWAHVTGSGSCATQSNTGNTAPTANAGNDYSIPKSTPFVLRGQGNDADGNGSLTYNWEQIDNEIATMPPVSTNTGGPMFRSLPSKTSPDRYMPALATVVAGSTSTTWEVLPSVARDLDFALTVRDNNAGGGSSARDDMRVTVTSAAAFTVSAPSTAVTWDTGTSQTITWNKGTTDQAPINCANVNIKLSVDGGLTFPITLKSNTPNDGSESIVVPDNATTTARIMVEAADNIFYNVNSTNFTINSTTPTFILTDTSGIQAVCNTGGNTASYTLNLDFVNGFSENVTFSTSGQPSGSTVSFSPTSINTDGNVTMTVSNLDGASSQIYTINITASSTSVTQNINASLNILTGTFNTITLSSPNNGSTGVSILPTLQWTNDTNAASYDVQIATDGGFSNLIVNSNSTTNSFTPNGGLSGTTTYYWRVKPKNSCGEGAFSSAFSFTTENPSYCSSIFTNNGNSSEFISNVTFNTINNNSTNGGSTNGYQDFTSINTTVTKNESHTISVTFDAVGYQDHCYVFIDWNRDFQFNNTTERYDLGSRSGNSNTATLNITIPSNAAVGSTRMRVIIEYFDGPNPYGEGACDSDHKSEWGETEDYTINVESSLSVEDFAFEDLKIYPIPSNGKVNVNFKTLNSDKVNIKLFDFRGRIVSNQDYHSKSSIFSKEIDLKASSGLYLMQIENSGKQTTRKIVIK